MSGNKSDHRERNIHRDNRKAEIEYGSTSSPLRNFKGTDRPTLRRPHRETLEERFSKRVCRSSTELEGSMKFLDDRNVHVTRHTGSDSKEKTNYRFDRECTNDFRRYDNNDLKMNNQEYKFGESMLESSNYTFDQNRPFDKKRAFLLALQDSPKSSKTTFKERIPEEREKAKKSQDKINSSSLFVGNLFNSVENEDIERLLEPYGSIIEVRRYEKHAIVTLNSPREKAEQATKDLDHNHWMDNWIRVKFNKFELSKEKSWKLNTKKMHPPGHSKYAHCDRADINEVAENEMVGPSERESTIVPAKKRKCKVIDLDSKRTLSKFLKGIRHDHCVEVVDSLVKAQQNGKLEISKEECSVPLIAGIQVTSKTQDPRQPIVYADIDF